MDDPFKTFEEIRSSYLRYLDSPFRLRYKALMDERRQLFDQDRQLYRRPLFEPIVPYESSGLTIHDACDRLGVSRDAADFMSCGLFPTSRQLYRHQFEAWQASRAGDAVVVTSATSSGKTECYLVPVFASLVEESMRWSAPSAPASPWWDSGGGGRTPQRSHEPPDRCPALRALFLYPLNALIEDQLGRIREACDGRASREWMSQNRPGQHFWFGRYTGATPVSGVPSNDNKRSELRRRLRLMQREWTRAVASAAAKGNARILNYFQDPSGSEMWSRWDMQDHPPDILITNYSMLNIMLMRAVEESIFDHTRDWLARNPGNRFHLIVDELHSYRGTPGTEVGYLLRALLERLGLTPDSPQLRIIATSASIEDNAASMAYLEQFFGRDPGTFRVISGHRRPFPSGPGDLPNRRLAFARAGAAVDSAVAAAVPELTGGNEPPGELAPVRLAQHLFDSGAVEAVRAAGKAAPFTVEELALRVFGSDAQDGVDAARGLVRCLAAARDADGVAPLPLRVHYFFHNAGRLWTCINPDCSGRFGQTPAGADAPPVGRLYTEPRPRCSSCEAAVLELLYCQPCGEVFLGGFHKPDPDSPNAFYLSPDYPDLDRVPDRSTSLKRSVDEYMVFWPAAGRRLAQTTHQTGPQWQWQQDGQRGWRWTPALLDHESARLSRPPRSQPSTPTRTAGFVFWSPVPDANAFASKCPHCGADWARRRVGSSIRDLGSGFQRVVQLLCDAMMRELDPESRKLVLFSDSRSDAAKLSTGIKLAHHLDTLRQVAYEVLAGHSARSIAAYNTEVAVHLAATELSDLEKRHLSGPLDADELAQRQRLLTELPPEVTGEVMRHAAVGGTAPAVLTPPTPPGGFAAAPFNELLNAARSRLLEVGMNPGGPQPSVTKYRPRVRRAMTVWWHGLIDWDASPPAYRALQPIEQQLLDEIETSLRRSVVQDVLFADGSRDFESLNLGFLWVDADGPRSTTDEAAASVVRMLAQRRRFTGTEAEGQPQAPMYIQTFLTEVANRAGMNPLDLHNDVVARLGPRLMQWLIAPERMVVLAPRPDANQQIAVYRCARCGRSHLHHSGAICTTCLRPLPPGPTLWRVDTPPEDFYEFLARSGTAVFRLHCEELTGQTNTEDRIARQRRFQDVFLDDEFPEAAGVDLLSVTTTMEAGVDIGSLQAISLANMPPVRFNYQQRVGRAGRRGLGTSAVLTLCRGRSHDDYYFERPTLITSEPPPTPYVDVSRPEIARRVIAKEVLRRAFGGIPVPVGGDNVHGEFDIVDEWFTHRPIVETWVVSHRASIESICGAILRRTDMDTPGARLAMADYITNELLVDIDNVARHAESPGHVALSERLASMGVLPMFGFPTRVRYLYHERPLLTHGWPPDRGVVDRQLDIAISQFAPGAQTVKDDELHTSVGVVDYRPYGGTVVAASEPLGPPVEVGICRLCQALVPDPDPHGGCPFCTAARSDSGYRTVDLSEPRGFTTWFSINAEFTGGFEFTPRALRARIGSSPNPPLGAGNFTVDAGSQRVYRVNDNDGRDFIFRKLVNQDVWMTEAAFDQALQDLSLAQGRAISRPTFDPGDQPDRRALAAIANTDVMTAGIAAVPVGLCLNPAVPEARAAWYSFGFLVRRAAAVSLDVAESELDLGIQPVMDFSSPFAPPSARVFLSDALENGAGYCTHLGEPARFESLLQFITGTGLPPDDTFWRPLVDAPHEADCASSCHRCLREFGNMAYHPLLDWRLGLDMARLALDASAQIDLGQSYWTGLVARIAGPYFLGLGMAHEQLGSLHAGVDVARRDAVVLTHPLWDTDRSNYRADVAAAVAEGERRGLRVELRSLLRAVRIPYE